MTPSSNICRLNKACFRAMYSAIISELCIISKLADHVGYSHLRSAHVVVQVCVVLFLLWGEMKEWLHITLWDQVQSTKHWIMKTSPVDNSTTRIKVCYMHVQETGTKLSVPSWKLFDYFRCCPSTWLQVAAHDLVASRPCHVTFGDFPFLRAF